MKYYVTFLLEVEPKPFHKVKEFDNLLSAEDYARGIDCSRDPKILREYPRFDSLSDIDQEISRLRTEILFGGIGDFDPDVLPPMAKELYFLLLNDLNSAGSHARLANYNNMQGR